MFSHQVGLSKYPNHFRICHRQIHQISSLVNIHQSLQVYKVFNFEFILALISTSQIRRIQIQQNIRPVLSFHQRPKIHILNNPFLYQEKIFSSQRWKVGLLVISLESCPCTWEWECMKIYCLEGNIHVILWICSLQLLEYRFMWKGKSQLSFQLKSLLIVLENLECWLNLPP